MTRYDYIKTLTPEQFLIFMTTKASSVCSNNANGEKWKTICKGKFEQHCDKCQRWFWIEEDISDGKE